MDNIRELKNAFTNIQNIETCDDYLKLRANLTNTSQFGLQSPSKLTSFPQLDDISQMKENIESHPENNNPNRNKYKKHNDTVFEQANNNTTNLQSEFEYPTHKTRILEDEQIDRQQFLNGIDDNQFFESSFDDDSTLQDINKMFNFGRQKQQQQRNKVINNNNNNRKQSDIYNNYNPNRPQAAQNYVMNQDPSIKRLLNGVDKTIAMATSQKNFGYHSKKYDNQKQNYNNTAEENTNKVIENSDIKAYLESIEKRFKITTNQQNQPKQNQNEQNKQSVQPKPQPQQQHQQKQKKSKKSKKKQTDLSVIQDDVFGEEFDGINTNPSQNYKQQPEKKRIFYSKTEKQQSSGNKQEISAISTTVDTKVMMQNQNEIEQKKKHKKHKHRKSKYSKKCVSKKHKHKHKKQSSSSSDNSSDSDSQSSSESNCSSRSLSSDDEQAFSSSKKQKKKQTNFNDSFDDYDDKASQISSANSIYSDLMYSQALSGNNIAYLKQKYGRNSASIQNRLNYLIQQRRKQQDSNDDTEEVFCIDCEEYIKIENVEAHANICQGKRNNCGNSLVDDSRTLFEFDNFQADNNDQLELHEYNQKMKKYLTQLKEKLKNFNDKSIPTSEFTAICEICCLQIECIQQMILNNCSNQDLTTQISDLAILNKHLLTIQRTRIYNIVKLSARIRNIAKHKQILLFPNPSNENLQQLNQQQLKQTGNIKQAQLVVSQFTSPMKCQNLQQNNNQYQQNQSNIPMNSIHCNQSDLLQQSPSSIFSSISQKYENCNQIQLQKRQKNQSSGNLFKKKNQQSQEKLNQNFIEQFSELNAFSAILNQVVENSTIQEHAPQTKLQQQCNEQILNERKKQFFSIVMKAKQQLPQNHPGKNVLINDLYQQAQEKKIPVEKWEEYIVQQLKQSK